MRVRLPDTPTLAEVAGEVMRTCRRLPTEYVPTEWRIAPERYARVVAEVNEVRLALGNPMPTDAAIMVCGIPLFPDMSPL